MSTEAPLDPSSYNETDLFEICFGTDQLFSNGIFVGDSPFQHSLPTALFEVGCIILLIKAVHFILQHLGQNRVISQIIAGILIGPTVAGRSVKFRNLMFPARNVLILDNVSLISFILFLFIIGVKTDISLLKKSGRPAIILCAACSVVPYAFSWVAFLAGGKSIPADLRARFLLSYLAGRLSLSSFPVVSSALEELGLLNSDLGRVVLSATLVADLVSYALHAGVMMYELIIRAASPTIGAAMLVSVFVLMLFIYYMARPVTLWLVKRTPPGELVSERCFIGVVLAALMSSCISESIG